MATYLIAATAMPGHVLPMLAIGRHLAGLGHRVLVHTASQFRAQVEAVGATLVPFDPAIDHDYRTLESRHPAWRQMPGGHARLCYGLRHFFADAMAPQLAGLRAVLAAEPVDAILVDTMFCGALPLLLGPRSARPPVLAVGITALSLSSCDTAFFGTALAPSATLEGRVRNLAMNGNLKRAMFGPLQQYFDQRLAELGAPALPDFVLDALITLPDRYLQLTAAEFEYPRSDLPASVRFVGPLAPPAGRQFEAPSWWPELDDGRPLVLVTQGTLANDDPGQLILPTLEALAGRADLQVIATTGGPVPAQLAALPANARIVPFVPYDRLLPKVAVMVTNGGYGAVNHALSLGVPLVVAGASEEKPEIAARVAWSGAGINLGTGKPGTRQLAQAVHSVLAEPRYRQRAAELRSHFARCNALTSITDELRALQARASAPEHRHTTITETETEGVTA